MAGAVVAGGALLLDRRKQSPAAIERSFFWAHTTPALLCDLDRVRVREANLAASTLFQVSREGFLDLPLAQLFAEADLRQIRDALQRAESPAEGWFLTCAALPLRTLQVRAFALRRSSLRSVALCCEDITAALELQSLVRLHEEAQQAFLSSLPVAASLYDGRGRFLFGNARFEQTLPCFGVAAQCPRAAQPAHCQLGPGSLQDLVQQHLPTVIEQHAVCGFPLQLSDCGTLDVMLFPVLAEAGTMVGLIALNLAEAAQERQRATSYSKLLRALATRALQMREAERAEIAREIHDQIGQEVAVMNLGLTRVTRTLGGSRPVDAEQMAALLANLEHGLGKIMQTVRRLATTLRPELLNTLGLAEAASALISELRVRVGIRATVVCQEAWRDPEPKRALQMYRCLQEALTNVTKHACASRVTVTLGMHNGNHVLLVEDNGTGIPAARAAEADIRHLGLVGMSERVLAFAGDFHIDTRPDYPGTRLRIAIPADFSKDPHVSDHSH